MMLYYSDIDVFFQPSVHSNNFTNIEYSLDHNHPHQHHHFIKSHVIGEASCETDNNNNNNNSGVIDYILNNHPQHQQFPSGVLFGGPNSSDKLSFADVMQFADFGPKLALNQMKNNEEETALDPICFLKFPVLNEEKPLEYQDEEDGSIERYKGASVEDKMGLMEDHCDGYREEEDGNWPVSHNASSVHQFLGDQGNVENKNPIVPEVKGNNKRKRPRTIKTSEEVESQRMTHIAVERNRRKQMNEHLRVLRSLMPGSYVQRGDQASIIGGAIEFVRELEQLLQCLESQKRRRLFGDGGAPRQMGGDPPPLPVGHPPPAQPQFFPPLPQIIPNDQIKIVDYESGLQEETAESKSCLADVEVKVLGFDAMIKILSRRRPGQLIKTIAALEDLQLNILHTNITTIEQTVLYSFNVKVSSETRFTAEDIASSVQQIFSFINANSAM